MFVHATRMKFFCQGLNLKLELSLHILCLKVDLLNAQSR
jgi:hypothetical protein